MKRKNQWKLVSLLPLTWGISLAACTNNVAVNQNSSSEKHTNPSQPTIDDSNHDGNNATNDQADEVNSPPTKPELSETTFSELNGVNRSVDLKDSSYAKQAIQTVWTDWNTNLNEKVIPLLKLSSSIQSNYQVNVQADAMTFVDENVGMIKDVLVVFRKNHQYQNMRINFHGLQAVVLPNNEKVNPKSKYLTIKEHINAKILGLFPSFLANMLFYADHLNEYSKTEHHEEVIKLDYYSFLNGDEAFVNLDNASLNHGLLNSLFDYHDQNDQHYQIKVVGIKFDDLLGTMGLKIRISNAEHTTNGEPDYETEFDFSHFRQLSLSDAHANVLTFSLPMAKFKAIINKNRPVKQLFESKQYDKNLLTSLNQYQQTNFQNQLTSGLVLSVVDNQHHVYVDQQSELGLNNFSALENKSGIYPFYTDYNRDQLLDNIQLKLVHGSEQNGDQVTISFDVSIPAYVVSSYSTISDLLNTNNQKLTFPITTTVALSSLSN